MKETDDKKYAASQTSMKMHIFIRHLKLKIWLNDSESQEIYLLRWTYFTCEGHHYSVMPWLTMFQPITWISLQRGECELETPLQVWQKNNLYSTEYYGQNHNWLTDSSHSARPNGLEVRLPQFGALLSAFTSSMMESKRISPPKTYIYAWKHLAVFIVPDILVVILKNQCWIHTHFSSNFHAHASASWDLRILTGHRWILLVGGLKSEFTYTLCVYRGFKYARKHGHDSWSWVMLPSMFGTSV